VILEVFVEIVKLFNDLGFPLQQRIKVVVAILATAILERLVACAIYQPRRSLWIQLTTWTQKGAVAIFHLGRRVLAEAEHGTHLDKSGRVIDDEFSGVERAFVAKTEERIVLAKGAIGNDYACRPVDRDGHLTALFKETFLEFHQWSALIR